MEITEDIRKMLAKTALRKGVDQNDVDDVVQDVAVRALQGTPQARNYYRRILDSVVAEYFRNKPKVEVVSLEDIVNPEAEPALIDATFFEQVDFMIDLEKALCHHFNTEEQQFVVKVAVEGFSVREAAALFPSRSRQTWDRFFREAIEKLKTHLADYGEIFGERKESQSAA